MRSLSSAIIIALLGIVANAPAQAPRPESRTGVLVAEFDPPTIGKINGALTAAKAAQLDHVHLVIREGGHSKRAPAIPMEVRRSLLQLIATRNPRLVAGRPPPGEQATTIMSLSEYDARPSEEQAAFGPQRPAILVTDPTQFKFGRRLPRRDGVRIIEQAMPYEQLPHGIGADPIAAEGKIPRVVARELRRLGYIKGGRGIYDLPESTQQTVDASQLLNDRISNNNIFARINPSKIPMRYRPENRPVERLWVAYVPSEEIQVLGDKSKMPAALQGFTRGGRKFEPFVVHPMSKPYFEKAFGPGVQWRELLYYTPLASHRSIIAWDPQSKDPPLSLKVSLNATIGSVSRMLSLGQIQHARVASATFASIGRTELERRGILFVDEPVHKVHVKSGQGFSVRESPLELPAGVEAIPWFALVSRAAGGEPRILKMIRESGLDARTYVERFVLRPLIEQNVWLGLEHGLVGGPHDQNIMAQIVDGKLTGRFYYLDAAAFYVKRGLRAKAGHDLSYLPPDLRVSEHETEMVKNLWFYLENSTFYSLQLVVGDVHGDVSTSWVHERYEAIFIEQVRARTGFAARSMAELTDFLAARQEWGLGCILEALTL